MRNEAAKNINKFLGISFCRDKSAPKVDRATRGSGNLERSGAEKEGFFRRKFGRRAFGDFFWRRVELWGQVNGWIWILAARWQEVIEGENVIVSFGWVEFENSCMQFDNKNSVFKDRFKTQFKPDTECNNYSTGYDNRVHDPLLSRVENF